MHCWLSGLTGSLAPLLLAPWLIANSQTAWVIGCLAHSWHSDSLLPPCHLANFLAHRWLSGTLAGSLAPLLPGSLAPWLLVGSLTQCWLTGCLVQCQFTGYLAHCWHSDSLLPPCHLANSLAHCWLSGLLASSMAPCLLPGSLLVPCWFPGY